MPAVVVGVALGVFHSALLALFTFHGLCLVAMPALYIAALPRDAHGATGAQAYDALVRRLLADHVFDVPRTDIRVITYDVGGGFGMKVQAYADYGALLYAARKLGRPVKWTASRLESFLCDTHGRDGQLAGERLTTVTQICQCAVVQTVNCNATLKDQSTKTVYEITVIAIMFMNYDVC